MRHPAPRVADLLTQIGMRRVPAKQIAGATRVAYQDRRISSSARSRVYSDRSAGNGLSDVDDLPYGIALRVRQITGATGVAIEEIVERPYMRVRNVHDMDVVAHAGFHDECRAC